MADVFLSYSSADRAVATHIEAALSAAGCDVFWDQETPTGRDWNSWIGEKLAVAKVVVVLWSKTSVASRNVVHEATIAVEAGKLIPVYTEALKSTEYPMGFYTVQGADLRGFSGQPGHPGMAKLLAAVKEQIGAGAGTGAPKTRGRGGAKPALRWVRPTVIVAAIALIAIFGGRFVLDMLAPAPTATYAIAPSELAGRVRDQALSVAPQNISVAISTPTGNASVEGRDLPWRLDGQLQWIKGALWEEDKTSALQRLLISSFDRSGAVVGALRSGSGVADVDVNWDITTFEIVERNGYPAARFFATVKLLDARTHRLIGGTEFEEVSQLSDKSVSQATSALKDVAQRACDNIVKWAVSELAHDRGLASVQPNTQSAAPAP